MQVKTYAQLVVSLMLSVPLAAYADNVVQDVGHGVGEVASGVWEGTKDIGTGIGNAAHDIGRGINNAFTGGGNGGVRNSSDQTITNTVKSSLAVDPSISNTADITVTTKNGVVDLSGTVDNQAQAAKAIEIAASIDGVKDIYYHNLKFGKDTNISPDVAIMAMANGKVKWLAANNKIASGYNLQFISKNGAVQVTGLVGNKKDIDTVKNAISSLHGVTSVKMSVK